MMLVRVKFDEKWVNKTDSSITKANTGMDLTTFQADAPMTYYSRIDQV